MKDRKIIILYQLLDITPFILVAFYISFGSLIENDNIYIFFMFTSFIAWILFHFKDMRKRLNPLYFTWLIFISYLIFSIIYSADKINSFKFSMVYFMILVMGICISLNPQKYLKIFMQVLWFFLLTHIVATFISYYNIDLITAFCSNFMKRESCLQIERWANEFNSYAGIAGQLGTNALMISFSLMLTLSKLVLSKNKKYIYFFIFILGCIALFLTGKETFYLANIGAIIVIAIIYILERYPSYIKMFLKLIGLIGLLAFIILILNFDKFYALYYEGSIDSRLVLYNDAFDAFKTAPIFGHGINTIMLFSKHLTHNIFLQLAAETGLIGLSLFIIASIITFYKTIQTIIFQKKFSSILIVSLYLQALLIIDGFVGNPLFDYKFIMIYFFIIFTAISKEDFDKVKLGGV